MPLEAPHEKPSAPEVVDGDQSEVSKSAVTRWILVSCGCICLLLGGIGIVLPGLPTTPLVLVAAACFSRSSPRFKRWLESSRIFGPLLREWREHRAIPRGAKRVALVLVTFAFSVSIYIVRDRPVTAYTLAVLGIALFIYLARLRVCPIANVQESDANMIPEESGHPAENDSAAKSDAAEDQS